MGVEEEEEAAAGREVKSCRAGGRSVEIMALSMGGESRAAAGNQARR